MRYLLQQRSVAVSERTEFSPTVDLCPHHVERTEFSPRVDGVADEHVPVKEEPIVAVDAALTMEVKICEAVPACMESMGLLIEVLQMVLSPAVYGAVVGRCVGALAVLASMAVNIECSGSDPPGLRWLVDPGCDPPMLSCC